MARLRTLLSIPLLLALLTVTLVAGAGCGGDDPTTTTSPGATSATTAGGEQGATTTAAPVEKTGAELFAVFCAGCHGEDGKAIFAPPVVGVDAEALKKAITEGVGEMKGYGDTLPAGDIQKIVDYALTLE